MASVLIRAIGQMGITGRGEDAVVTEDFLHFQQVNTGLDQMRGIAVTQAMRANLFFKPQSWATWRNVICTPPRSSGVVARCAAVKPP